MSLVEKNTDIQDIPCPICNGKTGNVCWRRRNTQYRLDEQNWVLSCLACWREEDNYWAEMWDEYLSDRW
jgi:C4-type Zn-finger protein